MPALEVYVLVVSVILLLVLSVLTALTQFDPEGVAVLRWLEGVSRWFVPAEKFSEPYGPRRPGRRARKTQRRREKLAALKEKPHFAARASTQSENRTSPEDAVSLFGLSVAMPEAISQDVSSFLCCFPYDADGVGLPAV